MHRDFFAAMSKLHGPSSSDSSVETSSSVCPRSPASTAPPVPPTRESATVGLVCNGAAVEVAKGSELDRPRLSRGAGVDCALPRDRRPRTLRGRMVRDDEFFAIVITASVANSEHLKRDLEASSCALYHSW